VAVHDQADRGGGIVQCVQHAEVALARNAEYVVHSLDQQLIDQEAGAGSLNEIHRHQGRCRIETVADPARGSHPQRVGL